MVWPSIIHSPACGHAFLVYTKSKERLKTQQESLLQVVVANIGFAADAQHAEEERRKDDLDAKEQPHGPEQDLPDLIERPKITGDPLPGNPRASEKTDQEHDGTKD